MDIHAKMCIIYCMLSHLLPTKKASVYCIVWKLFCLIACFSSPIFAVFGTPYDTSAFIIIINTFAMSVWYSTDGHDRDPSSPPQGAPMVSTGVNSTSVTITLPESDNSCKPYYVWIAGNTPNGQQGPYSKRRQVEVCKASI